MRGVRATVKGGKPEKDTSKHRHNWLVRHRPYGPVCGGCGMGIRQLDVKERDDRD